MKGVAAMVLACVVFGLNCDLSIEGTIEHPSTAAGVVDSIALIDTAYLKPGNKWVSPPCGMYPDYCKCIRDRIEEMGSGVKFVCDR